MQGAGWLVAGLWVASGVAWNWFLQLPSEYDDGVLHYNQTEQPN